jgi:hypothetical protein
MQGGTLKVHAPTVIPANSVSGVAWADSFYDGFRQSLIDGELQLDFPTGIFKPEKLSFGPHSHVKLGPTGANITFQISTPDNQNCIGKSGNMPQCGPGDFFAGANIETTVELSGANVLSTGMWCRLSQLKEPLPSTRSIVDAAVSMTPNVAVGDSVFHHGVPGTITAVSGSGEGAIVDVMYQELYSGRAGGSTRQYSEVYIGELANKTLSGICVMDLELPAQSVAATFPPVLFRKFVWIAGDLCGPDAGLSLMPGGNGPLTYAGITSLDFKTYPRVSGTSVSAQIEELVLQGPEIPQLKAKVSVALFTVPVDGPSEIALGGDGTASARTGGQLSLTGTTALGKHGGFLFSGINFINAAQGAYVLGEVHNRGELVIETPTDTSTTSVVAIKICGRNYGTLVVEGTLDVSAGDKQFFQNYGTLQVKPSGTALFGAVLENYGAVSSEGALIVGDLYNAPGANFSVGAGTTIVSSTSGIALGMSSSTMYLQPHNGVLSAEVIASGTSQPDGLALESSPSRWWAHLRGNSAGGGLLSKVALSILNDAGSAIGVNGSSTLLSIAGGKVAQLGNLTITAGGTIELAVGTKLMAAPISVISVSGGGNFTSDGSIYNYGRFEVRVHNTKLMRSIA